MRAIHVQDHPLRWHSPGELPDQRVSLVRDERANENQPDDPAGFASGESLLLGETFGGGTAGAATVGMQSDDDFVTGVQLGENEGADGGGIVGGAGGVGGGTIAAGVTLADSGVAEGGEGREEGGVVGGGVPGAGDEKDSGKGRG